MGDWYSRYDDTGWSGPKRISDGIKARSARGTIGETWWSKRWVHTLESLGMGARLARGRSYARMGQVVSIDVEPGIVKSRVQGSQPRPYAVEIRLQPLADEEWQSVIEVMASQALFAAMLLAGEMPTNIEEAFRSVHLALFPTTKQDLVTKCSCPDQANPCKHIAAVYYILAERFDEDPFLLFKLRGRTRDQIIEALRAKRADTLASATASATTEAIEQGAPQEGLLRLEDTLATFWNAGEKLATFQVHPGQPDVPRAVLKRLGDAPFAIGKRNITGLLTGAYDAVDATITKMTSDASDDANENSFD